MNSSYSLNFVIPQGPTGPTGPSGTGLSAYGGKYSTSASTLNLGIGTQTQIPLSSNMPNLNTSYTSTNGININQGGIYEINYFINLSVALGTTLTLSVRNNGTNIPSTVVSRVLSASTNSIYSGSTIVNLPANSVIDMAASALVSVGVNLASGTNAILTVKKIG